MRNAFGWSCRVPFVPLLSALAVVTVACSSGTLGGPGDLGSDAGTKSGDGGTNAGDDAGAAEAHDAGTADADPRDVDAGRLGCEGVCGDLYVCSFVWNGGPMSLDLQIGPEKDGVCAWDEDDGRAQLRCDGTLTTDGQKVGTWTRTDTGFHAEVVTPTQIAYDCVKK